jgi:hypothetical protein
VFTSDGESIRYVRLTAEEARRGPVRLGDGRPPWRSARAVVETLGVGDGDPRPGAVVWSAGGKRVPYLETVWQIEKPDEIEMGLCVYDPEDRTASFRTLTLPPDGSRVTSESAGPPRKGVCPSQDEVDLYQPSVLDDARRVEVLAPRSTRSDHPRTAGIVLYDWRRRTSSVRLAPPEPLAISPGKVQSRLHRSDTPLRWRRRPAEALAAIDRWVPEDAHPAIPTAGEAIAYRMRHSAWTWWEPEWTREYRGRERWKITARFTRRRLDGRVQRLAAAWLVQFNDPHGPTVTAMGPNAWRLSRLTEEETEGIADPGDPDALVVDEATVSVCWSDAGEIRVEPGDRVEARLYCGSRFLGVGAVDVEEDGTVPPEVIFDRREYPCRARYHWSGPWIVPPADGGEGAIGGASEGWFVLDADDAFVFLPS